MGYGGGGCSAHEKQCTSFHAFITANLEILDSPECLPFTIHVTTGDDQMVDRWCQNIS